MDTNLFDRHERALKEAAPRAADENIPVGWVVSQSGRFVVKWSMASIGKFYDRLEDLIRDSIPLLGRREVPQNNS